MLATQLLQGPAGVAEKTINKPKRELKGLKKRPVFFSRQITVTMDPCSKAIELLAIEYPRAAYFQSANQKQGFEIQMLVELVH